MNRLLSALIAFACSTATLGEEPKKAGTPAAPPRPPAPEIFETTVSPAKPVVPALRYKLLPTMIDRHPGNAAILYTRAAITLAERQKEGGQKKASDWIFNTPINSLPVEEVRIFLDSYAGWFTLVQIASRRDTCQWENPFREQSVYDVALPEVGRMREICRLLTLKARYQVVTRDFEGAIATLQTGFSVVRHTAQGEAIVHPMMAAAIATIFLEDVRHFSAAPDSPSLYWALTALPSPLIDLEPGLDTEMDAIAMSFPRLAQSNVKHIDEKGWKEDFRDFLSVRLNEKATPASKVDEAIESALPHARDYFLARGMKLEELDQLPAVNLVAVHLWTSYVELRDETLKWVNVPWFQAEAPLRELWRLQELKKKEPYSFSTLSIPAIHSARITVGRVDGRIAALRTIEALRLHVSQNGGKLPAKLSEVTIVPIPIDPFTGKEVIYRLDEATGTAIIQTVAPYYSAPGVREFRVKIRQ